VDINLDQRRTTRPGARSPVHLLARLVRAHPDRTRVLLYRSPALSGALAKLVPPRFDEGWGTWRAKVYGADDDVLLSGCVRARPAQARSADAQRGPART
jgi:CDP-diacylglycerol--glycerol-3-phosphate 3-phosphatidyltransferase